MRPSGLGMENIIKTTVFLKDMNDFAAMNEVYASFFTSEQPVRSAPAAWFCVHDVSLPKSSLGTLSSYHACESAGQSCFPPIQTRSSR